MVIKYSHKDVFDAYVLAISIAGRRDRDDRGTYIMKRIYLSSLNKMN